MIEKFDYCISNPPYQESLNGVNKQIWPNFINMGTIVSQYSTFITPGRWVNPKKSMIPIRNNMINYGLKEFTYIIEQVFDGVNVDGGLSITNYDYNYKNNDCLIKPINKKDLYNNSITSWNPSDKFFLNSIEERIYKKIVKKLDSGSMDDRRVGNLGSLGNVFFGVNKNDFDKVLTKDKNSLKQPVKVWANNSFGKSGRFEWFYIERDKLVIDNDLLLNSKVMISKIGHADTDKTKNNIYNNVPVVLKDNEIGLGSVFYLVPDNNTVEDCELVKSYMMTRFVRMLMNISQKDLYVRGLDNVPDYVFLKNDLYNDGLSSFNDEWLFDYFGFDDELINYCNERISVKTG